MLETDLSARLNRTAQRVQKRTGVSLAFGGLVLPTHDLALGCFSGPTVGALPGVKLAYDQGLGGRAVASRRPIAVNDYVLSERITHRYDLIIQSEKIRSIAAAPVIVGRRPVAMVYGTFRTNEIVGDRIRDVLNEEARCLEQELVSLQILRGYANRTDTDVGQLHGRVGEAYGELRALSRRVEDPDLQRALGNIAKLLCQPRKASAGFEVSLTRRELDVLALAACGLSNRAIAERLGLTVDTVKGYMKQAMSKLHAKTRLQAAIAARRVHLLPLPVKAIHILRLLRPAQLGPKYRPAPVCRTISSPRAHQARPRGRPDAGAGQRPAGLSLPKTASGLSVCVCVLVRFIVHPTHPIG